MSTAIGEVNDDNFEREVLQSEEPVLGIFGPSGARPAARSRRRLKRSRWIGLSAAGWSS